MEQLLPYQQRKLESMRTNPHQRGIFLPYGTGKSWIALLEATWQLTEILIVLCINRNRYTWRREIEKRFPDVTVHDIQELTKNTSVSAFLRSASSTQMTAVLVPYHTLYRYSTWLNDLVCASRLSTFIIADESSKIKNPRTRTTGCAIELSKHLVSDRKLLLSGNPMPEGPHELWAQFQFLYGDTNPFGTTYYQFLRRWFVRSDYAYMLRLDLREKFFDVFREHGIFMDRESNREHIKARGIHRIQYVIETYQTSAEQRKLTTELYKTWSLTTDAGDTEDYNYAITLLTKAQQITGGFYYRENGSTCYLRHNPKLNLLDDVVQQLYDECPHRRIVVWHYFHAEIELIRERLSQTHRVLVGPSEDALAAFVEAGDKNLGTIILMPATVTQGFNELVSADTAVFFSNTYSNELREQAESRLVRIGQRSSVVVQIDLCSPTQADSDVVTALQCKTLNPAKIGVIVNKYTKGKQCA